LREFESFVELPNEIFFDDEEEIVDETGGVEISRANVGDR
jgi:hypothetical protein